MTSTVKSESEILDDLGVPPAARGSVAILSTSAHMDWDWLERFPILVNDEEAKYFTSASYDSKPSDTILRNATNYLVKNKQPIPPKSGGPFSYYYDVCEIGFLRAFCEDAAHGAQRIKELQSVGNRLRIVGGGITSPDSLLPNGEAFIRDYLAGIVWVTRALGQGTCVGWIPDDFGHDPQLPVLFEAMGIPYAGFARVPGDEASGSRKPINDSQSVAQQLTGSGCDFMWQAADGSTAQAYWMPHHYSQGSGISSGADIATYIRQNAGCSKTPYIHVPICDDFMNANGQLLDYVASYNQTNPPTYAVLASFADYAALVSFHREKIKTIPNFLAIPYWMGFYASRPANKTYHEQATRALLGGETFSLIARLLGVASQTEQQSAEAFSEAWELLSPSTHHDYITGTAGTQYADVYAREQLPLLARALREGESLRDQAIRDVAGAVAVNFPGHDYSYDAPFVAFNQLGFGRTDVVEIQDGAALGAKALKATGAVDLVQPTPDGNLLAVVSVPSLGFGLDFVNTYPYTTPSSTPTVSISSDQGSVTLENGSVRVTVSSIANWCISELIDKASGGSVLSGNMQLVVFSDGGSIYTFGNEHTFGQFYPAENVTWQPGTAQIVERGPLRVSVVASVTMTLEQAAVEYTLKYSLVAGESFVRVAVTGRALDGTSVMISLPVLGGVGSITRGTGYHWDSQTLIPYWPGYVFYPTHDYVRPTQTDGSATSAVVYHAGIPAWGYAIDNSGVAQKGTPLYGVLFRNTSQSAWGAGGSDNGMHTQVFAIRPSDGAGVPEDGTMLKESRRFSTPLIGRLVSPFTTGSIKSPQYSLAEIDGESQPVFLTAAKQGSFDSSDAFLRVYNPTNESQKVTVKVAEGLNASQSTGATALEAPLPPETEAALGMQASASVISFSATRAVTTLKIPMVSPNGGCP